MQIKRALIENPVRIMAILTAGIAVAIAFGADITNEQQNAVLMLAAAIFGGGELVRSQVSPTTKVDRVIDEAARVSPGPADNVSKAILKDKLDIAAK